MRCYNVRTTANRAGKNLMGQTHIQIWILLVWLALGTVYAVDTDALQACGRTLASTMNGSCGSPLISWSTFGPSITQGVYHCHSLVDNATSNSSDASPAPLRVLLPSTYAAWLQPSLERFALLFGVPLDLDIRPMSQFPLLARQAAAAAAAASSGSTGSKSSRRARARAAARRLVQQQQQNKHGQQQRQVSEQRWKRPPDDSAAGGRQEELPQQQPQGHTRTRSPTPAPRYQEDMGRRQQLQRRSPHNTEEEEHHDLLMLLRQEQRRPDQQGWDQQWDQQERALLEAQTDSTGSSSTATSGTAPTSPPSPAAAPPPALSAEDEAAAVLSPAASPASYDVWLHPGQLTPELAEAGALADLGYLLEALDPRVGWQDIPLQLRQQLSLYGKSTVAVPLDGTTLLTMYRRDVLEELGLAVPSTWRELLAFLSAYSLARRQRQQQQQEQGQQAEGQAEAGGAAEGGDLPPYALCLPRGAACSQLPYLQAIWSSIAQTHGSQQGVHFDFSSTSSSAAPLLRPLLSSAAAREALLLLGRLLAAAAPHEGDEGCWEGSAGFGRGRCALVLGGLVQQMRLLSDPAVNASVPPRSVGAAPLPGSHLVWSRQPAGGNNTSSSGSGSSSSSSDEQQLQPCTDVLCPYAVRMQVQGQEQGQEEVLVNYAPQLPPTVLVGSVNRSSPVLVQLLSYQLLAYLASPERYQEDGSGGGSNTTTTSSSSSPVPLLSPPPSVTDLPPPPPLSVPSPSSPPTITVATTNLTSGSTTPVPVPVLPLVSVAPVHLSYLGVRQPTSSSSSSYSSWESGSWDGDALGVWTRAGYDSALVTAALPVLAASRAHPNAGMGTLRMAGAQLYNSLLEDLIRGLREGDIVATEAPASEQQQDSTANTPPLQSRRRGLAEVAPAESQSPPPPQRSLAEALAAAQAAAEAHYDSQTYLDRYLASLSISPYSPYSPYYSGSGTETDPDAPAPPPPTSAPPPSRRQTALITAAVTVSLVGCTALVAAGAAAALTSPGRRRHLRRWLLRHLGRCLPRGWGARLRMGTGLGGLGLLGSGLGIRHHRRRLSRSMCPKTSGFSVSGHPQVKAPEVSSDTAILVTDIQSSTLLWETLPADVMSAAVQLHHVCIRRLLVEHAGYESATEGDSFILAFRTVKQAVAFAIDLQAQLLVLPWPQELLQEEVCLPVYTDLPEGYPFLHHHPEEEDRPTCAAAASAAAAAAAASAAAARLSPFLSTAAVIASENSPVLPPALPLQLHQHQPLMPPSQLLLPPQTLTQTQGQLPPGAVRCGSYVSTRTASIHAAPPSPRSAAENAFVAAQLLGLGPEGPGELSGFGRCATRQGPQLSFQECGSVGGGGSGGGGGGELDGNGLATAEVEGDAPLPPPLENFSISAALINIQSPRAAPCLFSESGGGGECTDGGSGGGRALASHARRHSTLSLLATTAAKVVVSAAAGGRSRAAALLGRRSMPLLPPSASLPPPPPSAAAPVTSHVAISPSLPLRPIGRFSLAAFHSVATGGRRRVDRRLSACLDPGMQGALARMPTDGDASAGGGNGGGGSDDEGADNGTAAAPPPPSPGSSASLAALMQAFRSRRLSHGANTGTAAAAAAAAAAVTRRHDYALSPRPSPDHVRLVASALLSGGGSYGGRSVSEGGYGGSGSCADPSSTLLPPPLAAPPPPGKTLGQLLLELQSKPHLGGAGSGGGGGESGGGGGLGHHHQGSRGRRLLMFRGLRVRVGIHAGVASDAEMQYNSASARIVYGGPCVTACKAVADMAHGGQVFLSGAARSALEGAVHHHNGGRPVGTMMLHMGTYTPVPPPTAPPAAHAAPSHGAAAAAAAAAATGVSATTTTDMTGEQQAMPRHAASLGVSCGTAAAAAAAPSLSTSPSMRRDAAAAAVGASLELVAGVLRKAATAAVSVLPFARGASGRRAAQETAAAAPPSHGTTSSPAAAAATEVYWVTSPALSQRLVLLPPPRVPKDLTVAQDVYGAPVGRVSYVVVQVPAAAALLAWNEREARAALRLFEETAGTLLRQLSGGGGYMSCPHPGEMNAAFTTAAAAVRWAEGLRRQLLEAPWSQALLAHELCEPVEVSDSESTSGSSCSSGCYDPWDAGLSLRDSPATTAAVSAAATAAASAAAGASAAVAAAAQQLGVHAGSSSKASPSASPHSLSPSPSTFWLRRRLSGGNTQHNLMQQHLDNLLHHSQHQHQHHHHHNHLNHYHNHIYSHHHHNNNHHHQQYYYDPTDPHFHHQNHHHHHHHHHPRHSVHNQPADISSVGGGGSISHHPQEPHCTAASPAATGAGAGIGTGGLAAWISARLSHGNSHSHSHSHSNGGFSSLANHASSNHGRNHSYSHGGCAGTGGGGGSGGGGGGCSGGSDPASVASVGSGQCPGSGPSSFSTVVGISSFKCGGSPAATAPQQHPAIAGAVSAVTAATATAAAGGGASDISGPAAFQHVPSRLGLMHGDRTPRVHSHLSIHPPSDTGYALPALRTAPTGTAEGPLVPAAAEAAMPTTRMSYRRLSSSHSQAVMSGLEDLAEEDVGGRPEYGRSRPVSSAATSRRHSLDIPYMSRGLPGTNREVVYELFRRGFSRDSGIGGGGGAVRTAGSVTSPPAAARTVSLGGGGGGGLFGGRMPFSGSLASKLPQRNRESPQPHDSHRRHQLSSSALELELQQGGAADVTCKVSDLVEGFLPSPPYNVGGAAAAVAASGGGSGAVSAAVAVDAATVVVHAAGTASGGTDGTAGMRGDGGSEAREGAVAAALQEALHGTWEDAILPQGLPPRGMPSGECDVVCSVGGGIGIGGGGGGTAADHRARRVLLLRGLRLRAGIATGHVSWRAQDHTHDIGYGGKTVRTALRLAGCTATCGQVVCCEVTCQEAQATQAGERTSRFAQLWQRQLERLQRQRRQQLEGGVLLEGEEEDEGGGGGSGSGSGGEAEDEEEDEEEELVLSFSPVMHRGLLSGAGRRRKSVAFVCGMYRSHLPIATTPGLLSKKHSVVDSAAPAAATASPAPATIVPGGGALPAAGAAGAIATAASAPASAGGGGASAAVASGRAAEGLHPAHLTTLQPHQHHQHQLAQGPKDQGQIHLEPAGAAPAGLWPGPSEAATQLPPQQPQSHRSLRHSRSTSPPGYCATHKCGSSLSLSKLKVAEVTATEAMAVAAAAAAAAAGTLPPLGPQRRNSVCVGAFGRTVSSSIVYSSGGGGGGAGRGCGRTSWGGGGGGGGGGGSFLTGGGVDTSSTSSFRMRRQGWPSAAPSVTLATCGVTNGSGQGHARPWPESLATVATASSGGGGGGATAATLPLPLMPIRGRSRLRVTTTSSDGGPGSVYGSSGGGGTASAGENAVRDKDGSGGGGAAASTSSSSQHLMQKHFSRSAQHLSLHQLSASGSLLTLPLQPPSVPQSAATTAQAAHGGGSHDPWVAIRGSCNSLRVAIDASSPPPPAATDTSESPSCMLTSSSPLQHPPAINYTYSRLQHNTSSPLPEDEEIPERPTPPERHTAPAAGPLQQQPQPLLDAATAAGVAATAAANAAANAAAAAACGMRDGVRQAAGGVAGGNASDAALEGGPVSGSEVELVR